MWIQLTRNTGERFTLNLDQVTRFMRDGDGTRFTTVTPAQSSPHTIFASESYDEVVKLLERSGALI